MYKINHNIITISSPSLLNLQCRHGHHVATVTTLWWGHRRSQPDDSAGQLGQHSA